jgi:hypothetical protein
MSDRSIKYCPLLGTMRIMAEIKPTRAPCLKHECAWWHTYTRNGVTHSDCAIFRIADELHENHENSNH